MIRSAKGTRVQPVHSRITWRPHHDQGVTDSTTGTSPAATEATAVTRASLRCTRGPGNMCVQLLGTRRRQRERLEARLRCVCSPTSIAMALYSDDLVNGDGDATGLLEVR